MEDLIELKIIDTSQDGSGVGKLDGLTVFVPFAIEGETVLVSNLVKHKNYATAILRKIKNPSPRRRYAPCPKYGICGGCQLMHLGYETQTLFKQLSLATILKRGGIDAIVNPTKPSMEYEYRNSVQLKVGYEPQIKIGFYFPQSHELIDIENCIVCGDWFKIVRKILLEFLPATKGDFVENIFITCFNQNDESKIQLNFQTRSGTLSNAEELFNMLNAEFKVVSIWASKQEQNNTLLNYKTCTFLAGEKYLTFEFLNQKLSLQPTDFLQVNIAQAENIFTYLKNQIDIIQPNVLFDLFCGIGAFSTLVAPYCKNVYAVDINKSAIEKAKERAKAQNINNVHFFSGDCNKLVFDLEKYTHGTEEETDITDLETLILQSSNTEVFSQLLHSSHSNRKVVFLDPSRVGAGKNVLEFINKIDFSDVFYLSCNPHSLVKDLGKLIEQYDIAEIMPYDMFPQTNKIETLVHLTRKKEVDFELKVEAQRLKLMTV